MQYLLIFLICTSSALANSSKWIVMRSSNFEIYSTAGERATRNTLQHFEQVRQFFQENLNWTTTSDDLPVRITLMDDERDYKLVRPSEFAAAFYLPGPLRENIVIGNSANGQFPVAVHEYIHLLVKQAGLKLPLWMNEGVAELYETLEPSGKTIIVGKVSPGRWEALQEMKLIPLPTLISVTPDSPYYNEKDRAGSFYHQSWALTHMLLLSNRYRPASEKFLKLIEKGEDSAAAFLTGFGRTLPQVEMDLRKYLDQSVIQAVVFKASLDKMAARPKPEPVPDFDVQLLMTELSARLDQAEEAQAAFKNLQHADPKRPEPYIHLAYLAWRQKDNSEASGLFRKAIELGDRTPKVMLDFGRIANGSDLPLAAQVLDELAAKQPARVDVRIELASIYMRSRDAASALKALAPVKRVSPDQAPRFFELVAHAKLQTGDILGARESSERFTEYAKDEDMKWRAQRLRHSLDVATRQAIADEPVSKASLTDPMFEAPPAIRRVEPKPDPPAPPTPPPVTRPSVQGRFTSVDCSRPRPVLTVETVGKRHLLVLDEPDSTQLVGTGMGQLELTCGPQKPRNIRVEYVTHDTMPPGATGMVRLIEFLP